MKKLFVVLLCACFWFAEAQEMPKNINLGRQNPHPFLASSLWQVSESARKNTAESAVSAKSMAMPFTDGKVYVEIVNGAVADLEKTIDTSFLKNTLRVKISACYKNRVAVWIPASDLVKMGGKLPPGYSIQEVTALNEDNQGPALTNSATYLAGGAGGNGRRIAIIDGGFDHLTESRNAGAAPALANTTFLNYTDTPIESESTHGTACVETAFDHAPNAHYYIIKASALADLGAAVEECIDRGVDVISYSQSKYNTGWGDNSGPACAAAANAAANGILFFTSAGNRHGTHWQGNFADANNNNWHNWSGVDEQNDFTINSGGTVRAYLQWNSASTTDHFDLYLYQNGTNQLLASSTNASQFESLYYTASQQMNVYLAVRAKTANPPAFELFNHDDDCTNFQYMSTAGSTTSPSNTTAPNVISIGAVPRTDYEDAEGSSGIIASYSSRGPTNGGNLAPDLCAPTNTSTTMGSFSGTSCATPNAAGAATAFWSGHPQLGADGVRQILFAMANLYKDWGANGADNIYGRGGLYLYDFYAGNRYILNTAGNPNSAPSLPYIGITEVENSPAVPNGRRMIYLNAFDIVAPGGILINKPMLYKSIKGTLLRSGQLLIPSDGNGFTISDETETQSFADEAAVYARSTAATSDGSGSLAVDNLMVAPNPVKTTALITYAVAAPTRVELSVFDVVGKPVQNLVNTSSHATGTFQVGFDGGQLPPGVYLCRLNSGLSTTTVRMVIAR